MRNEEHDEQRQELLEAFKDHDKEAWAKYQSARVLKVQIVLERAFEAELDIAAAQLAQDMVDQAFADSIQRTYYTSMLIAGYTPAQAWQMASSFAMIWRPAGRHAESKRWNHADQIPRRNSVH